jgi:diguanylate cyclase (GGDEF)-like protein
MQKLDLFTLNCITILNAYLSSGAMYFVSRLNGTPNGVPVCAVAGFLMATGLLFAPFRDALPAHALNLLSNVLIFAGVCLLLRGIREFRGLRRVRLRRFISAIAIYASLFAYWMYGFDSMRARSVLASLAIAAPMAAAAWAMGINVPQRDRLVYWTTASFYAATALAAGLRSIWCFSAVPHASLFSPYPVELISIGVINLASLGGAFGLCLATNLRLMHAAEELSLYDPLTNLPNRRLLEDRLRQAEQRALSSGQPLALIYCDLDDFKKVNDQLGHAAGDRVLKTIASRLRGLLGEEACLARVGGDEFIVLIEGAATRKELDVMMDNLSNGVQELIYMDGASVSPAMSCGLAMYPEDVGSAADLMRLADAAMYSIKQQGKEASYPLER